VDKVSNQTRGSIWKYDLEHDGVIEMPAGAKVLSTGWQKPHVRMWVLVDPEIPKVKRRVKLLSTGNEIVGDGWEFVGTVLATPDLVHHVFLEVL
jgi:hypothetical protein